MVFRHRFNLAHGIPGPIEDAASRLLDAAFETHTELGPGLYEAVYQEALAKAAKAKGLNVALEQPVVAVFRGEPLGIGFRADMIVNNSILVEVKAVRDLGDVHVHQLLTYLKFSGAAIGFVINFHEPHLKNGIVRRVGPSYRPARVTDG